MVAAWRKRTIPGRRGPCSCRSCHVCVVAVAEPRRCRGHRDRELSVATALLVAPRRLRWPWCSPCSAWRSWCVGPGVETAGRLRLLRPALASDVPAVTIVRTPSWPASRPSVCRLHPAAAGFGRRVADDRGRLHHRRAALGERAIAVARRPGPHVLRGVPDVNAAAPSPRCAPSWAVSCRVSCSTTPISLVGWCRRSRPPRRRTPTRARVPGRDGHYAPSCRSPDRRTSSSSRRADRSPAPRP